MKIILQLLFVLYFLFGLKVRAQDSHLSQYFNMPTYVNPALAGNNIQNLRIAANYRSQWASSGSPFKTQTIALDKIVNHVGFGVMISKNSAGKDGFNKLNLLGGLSYHAKFGDNSLHEITAGFQVGLLQKSFDPNALSFENQYSYDVGYDPNASSGETFANTKVSRPDVNFGVTYYMGQGNPDIKLKPFAGIAFSHINKPKESFIELDNVTPIKTTFHGGMGIVCSKKLELKPMILFMKQDQFSELNAGIVSEFSLENTNTIKFGVFHRNKDAMIVYAGYQINKILLGTSYDVNTSAYNKASNGNGAFEISLVYTPQGKQSGKKIKKPEPKNTKPVNKKKLPEPKLTPPAFYSSAKPMETNTLNQTANVLEPVKPKEEIIASTQLPKGVKALQKKEEGIPAQPIAQVKKKIITPEIKTEPIKVEQPVAEKTITETPKQNVAQVAEVKKEIIKPAVENKITAPEIKAEPVKVAQPATEKTIAETPKQNVSQVAEVKKEIIKPVVENKITVPEIKAEPEKVAQPETKKTIAQTPKQNAAPVNELANKEFEKLDYVLFKEYTTNYDINNKFDIVESVIDFLYKYPSSKILLAGNTDDVEQRIKPALGYLRADEVKSYMINHGVDATRINLLNVKNLNPLSASDSESPIDLNRRVDIFLVK